MIVLTLISKRQFVLF